MEKRGVPQFLPEATFHNSVFIHFFPSVALLLGLSPCQSSIFPFVLD